MKWLGDIRIGKDVEHVAECVTETQDQNCAETLLELAQSCAICGYWIIYLVCYYNIMCAGELLPCCTAADKTS